MKIPERRLTRLKAIAKPAIISLAAGSMLVGCDNFRFDDRDYYEDRPEVEQGDLNVTEQIQLQSLALPATELDSDTNLTSLTWASPRQISSFNVLRLGPDDTEFQVIQTAQPLSDGTYGASIQEPGTGPIRYRVESQGAVAVVVSGRTNQIREVSNEVTVSFPAPPAPDPGDGMPPVPDPGNLPPPPDPLDLPPPLPDPNDGGPIAGPPDDEAPLPQTPPDHGAPMPEPEPFPFQVALNRVEVAGSESDFSRFVSRYQVRGQVGGVNQKSKIERRTGRLRTSKSRRSAKINFTGVSSGTSAQLKADLKRNGNAVGSISVPLLVGQSVTVPFVGTHERRGKGSMVRASGEILGEPIEVRARIYPQRRGIAVRVIAMNQDESVEVKLDGRKTGKR